MRETTLKSLKTILRMQRETVERLLSEKSACFIEIEKLKKEKEITLERLEKERHFAGEISSYQTFSEFTKKVQDKIDAVEKAIQSHLLKASKLEDAFISAYKRQKSQEIVLEKAEEEKLSLQAIEERKMLDETALRRFQKG